MDEIDWRICAATVLLLTQTISKLAPDAHACMFCSLFLGGSEPIKEEVLADQVCQAIKAAACCRPICHVADGHLFHLHWPHL